MTGVGSFLGTWLVVIVGLSLLARTKWGYPLVYGAIWLAVVLLVVSHADELTSFFNPQALELNG